MAEPKNHISENKIPEDLKTIDGLPHFFHENKVKIFSKDKCSMHDIIKHHIERLKGSVDNFYIVDLGHVVSQYKRWKKNFPNVQPHYAMKCCPDPLMIKMFADLGFGFDCASEGEIAKAIELGVHPDHIIYANTVKNPRYIEFAKKKNVNLMTFDDEAELYKIKAAHPDASLVLRYKTDDSHSKEKFSAKFGATLHEAQQLVDKAKELSLKIVGVSFHVGGKCGDTETWTKSVKAAREIFKMGEAAGMKMFFLDVGGGFPGVRKDSKVTFEDIARDINKAVETHFSDVKDLKVIAEPGRYFAETSHTLVLNVIGKRQVKDGLFGTLYEYYLSDGVYGSFNCIMFDQAEPEIKCIDKHENMKHKSTIFGPTCDSLDTICKKVEFPEMEVGDWCYVEDFGAYTKGAASGFNGFPVPECYYVFLGLN